MSSSGFRIDPASSQPAWCLVCVYYKVAGCDLGIAIARVRDFQRTLRDGHPGLETEVLVRSEACPAASDAAVAPGSEAAIAAPAAADATLMETYRLNLPAPSDPRAEPAALPAPIARLLADLESAALPLATLLRGPRHVELFSPCAW